MTIALQADVEALLNQTLPAADPALATMLEWASGQITDHLGWNPETAARVETLDGTTMRTVALPSLHVTAVASVVLDGVTLTHGAAQDYVWYPDGRVVRANGSWLGVGRLQSLVINYTSGYSAGDMPAALVEACARLAAEAWTAAAEEAATVPGGFKSERMPDGYEYDRGDNASSATATSSTPLPARVKALLAPWRLR